MQLGKMLSYRRQALIEAGHPVAKASKFRKIATHTLFNGTQEQTWLLKAEDGYAMRLDVTVDRFTEETFPGSKSAIFELEH